MILQNKFNKNMDKNITKKLRKLKSLKKTFLSDRHLKSLGGLLKAIFPKYNNMLNGIPTSMITERIFLKYQ